MDDEGLRMQRVGGAVARLSEGGCEGTLANNSFPPLVATV
jgi:hypothetical protein